MLPFCHFYTVISPNALCRIARLSHQAFAHRKGKDGLPSYYVQDTTMDMTLDVNPMVGMRSEAMRALVKAADRVGAMMQYRAPGFLKNDRQHRQFGLAAIEIAQVLTCPHLANAMSLSISVVCST